MINADLSAFYALFSPPTPAVLTTASATTATAGQFATFDASTPILVRSAANQVRVRAVLKSLAIPSVGDYLALVSGVDVGSVLTLSVYGGDGIVTVTSIAVTLGTLLCQGPLGAGAIGTRFVIQPVTSGVDAGKVNVNVVLSGPSSAVMTLEHRTFAATGTINTA